MPLEAHQPVEQAAANYRQLSTDATIALQPCLTHHASSGMARNHADLHRNGSRTYCGNHLIV